MSTLEIAEDLFFIERGYLNANHFVSRSRNPVLIDTGYIRDFDDTARSIISLGVDLSTVGLIVNTHTHCDHIGGNRQIQALSGCQIALHTVGKHFIDTRDDWSTWWRYFNQEADFFTCSVELKDGDVLAIGPNEFEVIYTPGHAADGLVLYNRSERFLISSDALWESDLPVVTIRVNGSKTLLEILESLQRIEALDVDTVYPGHGKPFEDMGAAIRKSRQRVEKYLRNGRSLGTDLLKKMLVYTLLMKRSVEESSFFSELMQTNWFSENVDFYFGGDYEATYHEIMGTLLRRDIIRRQEGLLITTVKP